MNTEAVFDPTLGLQGGSKYRDPETGRFVPVPEKKRKPKGMIMFRCKFCGKKKPLNEMMTLKRFFPPLVACRPCDRRIR